MSINDIPNLDEALDASDSAVLHYEPELDILTTNHQINNEMSSGVLTAFKANCPEQPVSPKAIKLTSKKVGRAKSVRTEGPGKEVELSDAELHRRFQTMILEDPELYLKVLHYKVISPFQVALLSVQSTVTAYPHQ